MTQFNCPEMLAEWLAQEGEAPDLMTENGQTVFQRVEAAIRGVLDEIEEKRMPISDEQDCLNMFGVTTQADAKHHVYKFTDCGAWIEFHETGIRVGSIVEGCDFGTSIYKLEYPFPQMLYERVIAVIEEEAEILWQWANDGCKGLDAPTVIIDDLAAYLDGRSA